MRSLTPRTVRARIDVTENAAGDRIADLPQHPIGFDIARVEAFDDDRSGRLPAFVNRVADEIARRRQADGDEDAEDHRGNNVVFLGYPVRGDARVKFGGDDKGGCVNRDQHNTGPINRRQN
ncbi:MAG TPA: hypothetical protein VEU53_08650 [Stellaceae bacterium]|nr:hypothetical protein [Stellaceae bacterium]